MRYHLLLLCSRGSPPSSYTRTRDIMAKKTSGLDQLFQLAERESADFALFPKKNKSRTTLRGVLPPRSVSAKVRHLQAQSVDDYIAQSVTPSEQKGRPSAKAIAKRLGTILQETSDGPLYAAEIELPFDGSPRRIGILAQERTSENGVWMPKHHLAAIPIIQHFAELSLPIIALIDTPGADAGDQANRENQAHAISRLIAEMALLHVPTIGIVIGAGYSGGAIPLATTNLLLSLRDGVFNTIQPQGLASIARKYDLSWQECAKYVGVSSYELYQQGYIDGIIDYVPGENENLENLRDAITSGISSLEQAAGDFVHQRPEIFDHYSRSVYRYLEPSDALTQFEQQSGMRRTRNPNQLGVFGSTYRYLRYLGLRRRICSDSTDSYGRLTNVEIPEGELSERQRAEHTAAFTQWLENPIEVRYDDHLSKAWKTFRDRRQALGAERGRIMALLRGNPSTKFIQARSDLFLNVIFYLYNLWKSGAHSSFLLLIDHLREGNFKKPGSETTILDILQHDELRDGFIEECQNVLIFDLIYNNIIQNQIAIAREVKDENLISRNSVSCLLEEPLEKAAHQLASKQPAQEGSRRAENQLKDQFYVWLNHLINHSQRGRLLKGVQEWKKVVFPRIPEPLFAIITYFFEHLLPKYYECEITGRTYEGRISPRDLGIRDFWNRLAIAYQDILINDLLTKTKKQRLTTVSSLQQAFFSTFEESDASLMTADPVKFPGFRLSIEQALSKGVKPCGLVTGVAQLKGQLRRKVGVAISNLDFQAGAFDMASCEKFCRLLVTCARKRLPVVAFISSGGMQTKEGAGSLFSMAILNDRLTRFVRDNNLPVVIFGFGDCTGGAQASFVTHPLVQSYYFSGTNMPFAGQIVVPAYLPSTSTLSNYLSCTSGAMKGLVKHPFVEDLDEKMQSIDRSIPVAEETVMDVLTRILKEGVLDDDTAQDQPDATMTHSMDLLSPVKRVLIHARGCTAAKLTRIAQENDIQVVLVQSDADMDSLPAESLTENDTLVCLGGNTSDESYLNAGSVVRIAEREGCDSLHPGIGFLSENPQFSALCHAHGINFIGPSARSMQLMGNKSNAIHTAIRLNVKVVPGSHGIVTRASAAKDISDKIGYPVILKAVHGGGGKGIQIVNDPDKLEELFLKISAEARSAFGNSDVYIEKCIVSLRHVEIQILRDGHGNTKVLGLRDCSVQRNNQKILEESGSTMLPEDIAQQMFDSAAAIANDIDYIGAGTVEFIFDLESNEAYFMEMNTRLQVEHPVTEIVSGIDIVRGQFDVAARRSIADLKPQQNGYAIEARINAEKAVVTSSGDVAFEPHPGEITECVFPDDDRIDIITMAATGKKIPPYYDSMIAQIIARGKDREDAVSHLLRYLRSVKISGICTNIPLVCAVLEDEVFRKGDYDTRYLPAFFERIDCEKLCEEIEQAAGDIKLAFDAETLRIDGSDELKVVASGTSVFYSQPSPNDPLFVQPGDVITTDQTLCLLEAMKVFRPLTLEDYNRGGTTLYDPNQKFVVVRVIPPSGQAVNSGDLLFIVRPA